MYAIYSALQYLYNDVVNRVMISAESNGHHVNINNSSHSSNNQMKIEKFPPLLGSQKPCQHNITKATEEQ